MARLSIEAFNNHILESHRGLQTAAALLIFCELLPERGAVLPLGKGL